MLIPDIVYSFSPIDFVSKPFQYPFDHDLEMNRDAKVSVIDG